jgi:hypothetical protein
MAGGWKGKRGLGRGRVLSGSLLAKGGGRPGDLKEIVFRVRVFFVFFFSKYANLPLSLCVLKATIYRKKCC